jgi:cytochrome c-type biogenesis protein CcmH/NrfG/transglutaminase-like putative cysteine protease
MRYENDGTGMREMHARVRVQSELGLRKVGQLVFDYNAANERLEIRSVRVIKSDGTIVTAGPESIQDLSAPVTREAPMYTDARQKHVTVPGLSVGDVLEYDTITTIFEPLTPGQFWQTWELVSDAICLDEQVDLNVPKNQALKLKLPSGVTQTTHDEGDRRVYHWATSTLNYPGAQELLANLQASARRFDFTRMIEGAQQPPARRIMFSTFQSWDEVARWYEGLERDRRVVTPDIQAKADEIVKGVSSDTDKAQALYQWVSANIRYVSLSFGVGRYQPHAAAEILANRYGDCKDKATLLAALMQAEGLRANTVLIDSRADVDPDVPSPLQFDHAITYAKIAGQDVWLDSTIGVGPFGYLLPQLRGKNALVADSASVSDLRRTPADLAIPRVYQVQLRSAAPVDGKRTIHLSFDTRGDMEVLFRLGFIQLPAGQMTALINQGMKAAGTASHGNDAEMEAVKTSDPTDTRKPFHIEADMVVNTEANGSSSSSSDTSSSATPFAREAELAQMLSYALPAAPEDHKATADEKPLQLNAPEEISLTVDVSTDQGHAQPPLHTHLSKDFAVFENDVEAQGQNYHATWRLVLNTREVPPAKLEDYRAFRRDVLAALNTGVSAAVGAPSAEAAELYSRAEEDMQHRNWTAGAAGMAQVIRVDPKYGYAWYELGRARMNTGEYPNAEIAYRKYVELEPRNRLANQGLAWVLAVEGKYDQVTKLLEPFVADNPNDAEMLGRLGGAYLELQAYDKAAATFEKAAALEPKNANTQVSLGRAYLGAGQNDKGVAAFQKAISLDDSALTLNNAAYYMGDRKVQMQLALQWGTRAVQQVENQLNDLTLQTIQSSNGQLTLELAEYWDTLAWIEYRNGNLPAAEKYARAGWELANVIAIGSHLGTIYQAEGLNPQATTAFAQTLALSPKNRQPSDDEREARKQLVALLGSDAAANDRIQQESANLETRRNVRVENSAKLVGRGQFIIIVGPGSAITDIESASPDNVVVALTDAVRAVKLLQTFPDETLRKLPEAGTLVCSSADQPCTFTPLPPIPSSRVFPPSQSQASNN